MGHGQWAINITLINVCMKLIHSPGLVCHLRPATNF